jgi:protein tyrosine/serine phosphatase
MKIGTRKLVKAAGMVICSIALIVAARLWYLEEQGNFHPVTPGEAYRSAQLDRDELENYINRFNIRSILNLRGKCADKAWYKEETETCRRLRVGHFDLDLSASQAPTPSQIKELLHLFRFAPRPVLIHCQGGADRSGLASAYWKVVVDREPLWIAERQLSIRYGHLPFGPTQVLDEFFNRHANKKIGSLMRNEDEID